MSFATRAANLVIRFVVVENAVFVVSDQSLCCQLVNHLFKQRRKKGLHGFQLQVYIENHF